ncbi:gluconokinase [Streptacidiphilus sp. MAP12-20]|uniref:gluconokinase n=1 Tax=Streptacidiphilus sp. MAP12-20 TaxID=3156299 RepID=UPI003512BD43
MGTSGTAPTIVVVMGVSASGKTTFGRLLAQRLGVPFLEGDDFHSAENRAKMTAGHPLDDADRVPWLEALADWIRETRREHRGGVLACSALKVEYRDLLLAASPGVWFLHLALDREVARERISRRAGHFMAPELLDSQYDTLQPLRAGEPGLTIDAAADTAANLDLVQSAVTRFEGAHHRTPDSGDL